MSLSTRAARPAAVEAAAGFLVVAGFQLLLALGVPWGRAAWGGAPSTLPPELRLASVASMIVNVGAALLVLGRAGYYGRQSSPVFRWGTWLLVAAMGVGTLLNLASPSELERVI